MGLPKAKFEPNTEGEGLNYRVSEMLSSIIALI